MRALGRVISYIESYFELLRVKWQFYMKFIMTMKISHPSSSDTHLLSFS